MKKAKNTTLDERLKIVTDCLANDKNYGAMALKYDCSYQQVRNWVIRYEKMGQAGLEDRRGRRIASLPSRTPEEELRDKIAELERRNLDLQMENDLLKKVRELEKEGALSLIHRLAEYEAIQKLSSTKHYPIDRLCKISTLHVLRITAGENIRKVIMNFETKDYPLKSKGFITSIQIWDTEGSAMN